MKRISTAVVPLIAVDRKSKLPLHRQIYDAYRAAILGGELRGAQQVPSTRLLAEELGISRIPIIGAYEELLAEGYFETRTGSGTFVSRSLPENLTSCEPAKASARTATTAPRSISQRGAAVPLIDRSPWILGAGAFSLSQLAYDHFPINVWSRLLSRQARNLRSTSLQYGSSGGRLDLREALAGYLRSARAVKCRPEQIIIVSGSQQALHIASLALLDPGDRVWMEDPGYWLARRAFILAGARIIPVPVDEEGLNVQAGIKLARRARLAFVTPSHQFPLGVTMSLPRRLQLLEWARTAGSWIVEDDYDSEYRYESRPLSSLQGLDQNDRIIYVGTFSKVLFPSVRSGYMVVPEDLVDRFLAVRQTTDVTQPDLQQAVLADFIREGHFARHLRRMRNLYAERRAVLETHIRETWGDDWQIMGDECGMHLTLALPKGFDDVAIAKQAAAQKLWVWPLSPNYYGPSVRHGLLLGFGGVATQEIPRAVRQLQRILESAM